MVVREGKWSEIKKFGPGGQNLDFALYVEVRGSVEPNKNEWNGGYDHIHARFVSRTQTQKPNAQTD